MLNYILCNTIYNKFYKDNFIAVIMKKEEHSGYGWGIAALILGILSFILAWIPFFGLILAIISLILSIMSIVKKSGTVMGIIGLVLSIISLLIALAITGLLFWMISTDDDLLFPPDKNLSSVCNQSNAKDISTATCKTLISNGKPETKINLVFIAADYTNLKKFYRDINRSLYNTNKYAAMPGLFEAEPLKSNVDKFNVYVAENFCLDFRSDIRGKESEIMKLLLNSSCPGVDQVVVLVDDALSINPPLSDYFDENYRVAGYAETNELLKPNETMGMAVSISWHIVLLHEFAHSFGLLCDEYSYLGKFPNELTEENNRCPNCAIISSNDTNIPCPKWANVDGAGCYRGCGFANLYRSSENSIMGGSIKPLDEEIEEINSTDKNSYTDFNNVSIIAMQKRLAEYS